MSSISISPATSRSWVQGQPVDDRSRTHVCVRPHTQRAVPLISGHQRPAAAGDNTPRIIRRQGQDTRAHSSWPSPGPPGTTNKVTGGCSLGTRTASPTECMRTALRKAGARRAVLTRDNAVPDTVSVESVAHPR